MSTIRVVNLQHTDATEPNIVLLEDGTSVFASGITISGGTNLTVSGTAEFASGTVSAPGVTFIDDNNTGFYSPATDTVAITTAAAERVRVDSSGNIGIGTTSPFSTNGTNLEVLHNNASGACRLILNNTDSSGLRYYIQSQNDGVLSIGDFTNAERLRIDSSGFVGIGTTSPSVLLDVVGTSGSSSVAEFSYTGGNSVYLKLVNASNALGFIGYETQDITFYNNNTERMRIDSSGGLLLGTTSSLGGELDIVNSAGAQISLARSDSGSTVSGNSLGQIRFYGNHGGTYSDIGRIICSADANHSSTSKPTNLRLYTTSSGSTASTERMRLDSSGRLLLGTTTPGISETGGIAGADKFTIGVTGNNHAGMTIRSGTSSKGTIYFADGTSGSSEYVGFIEYKHSDNYMRFGTSSIERMRIEAGGSVKITANSNVDNIYSGVAATGTSATVFRGSHSATTGSPGSGTDSIYIFANGNIQNTNDSYGQISDVKLKENIVDAGSQWDDFKAVRFRKYNFKKETGHGTHTQLGVIAQELELTSPGLVYETADQDEDGNKLGTTTKAVKSSILTKKALVALQEAMERIETLEQRLSDAGIA